MNKNSHNNRSPKHAILGFFVLVLLFSCQEKQRPEGAISEFGKYQGHSEGMDRCSEIVQRQYRYARSFLFGKYPVLHKGHRIRVMVTCANARENELLEDTSAPVVKLHQNSQLASRISLPILQKQ